MIRTMLLLLMLSPPVSAETARVLSGEHEDFTRLVIELPERLEWSMGRTDKGYAFAARGETQPDYDLSAVWNRIPRARLADLAVDKTSGALELVLGCDCHVFPFEYAKGIVVLDIKEGPPPEGSAFESAFPPPVASARTSDPTPSYDWLGGLASGRPERTPTLPLPLDTGTVSLEPLRNELLEQIAKGAADGVVDMYLPGKPPKPPAIDHAELPWGNIRIGEQPGITVTNPGALIPEQTAQESCARPDLLDLGSWGQVRLPHDILAEARSGLYGEFDQPDDSAILLSARQLLYLGFGAEARQHLGMLSAEADNDAVPLYLSMSHLVDGESDPQTPFAAMLECEGPAALWAALARDRLPAGPGVNSDAILQAFLSLPAHLRRHLGSGLAEKFIARDDPEAVRMIRDSMKRAPDVDAGSVALLDAKAKLQEGDADTAQLHAETAVALDGDRAESLVALVEAHFRKLQPVDPGIAEALLALRGESEGTSIGAEVDRAIVLALALSNQAAAAFDAEPAPFVLSDLWKVIQARASNDDFLLQAVLPAKAQRPEVLPEVAQATADRLLGLGFPDAALIWLGPVAATDAADLRLAAARAQLGRRDARAALALLDGIPGPDAESIRANALLQIGDLPAAKLALAGAGATETAARVGLWEGNWSGLRPESPEPWRRAADLAQSLPEADGVGLLGRGSRTVDASLAARDAIEALLASVPSPAGD